MVSHVAKQGITPRTEIDVGGNVGQFAVASARRLPDVRVYSFEPVPECASTPKKIAGCQENVTVFPTALGESEGEIEMNVNTHNHSSSVLPVAKTHCDAFPDAREEL
jgi:FkbM family methyltransferase